MFAEDTAWLTIVNLAMAAFAAIALIAVIAAIAAEIAHRLWHKDRPWRAHHHRKHASHS
jgi:hypothetical protein